MSTTINYERTSLKVITINEDTHYPLFYYECIHLFVYSAIHPSIPKNFIHENYFYFY